ncbi:hypothetical protein GGX14DRAFT_399767 [Mycena pura]|uniref:Uncharacterized protein n=1 Tax=Mycena pura TaxID=153505 RepID=A0AAD6V7N7_9AGAR|nr:hypothetical protein GGX14DRAFT_399767 [Mycena pura]
MRAILAAAAFLLASGATRTCRPFDKDGTSLLEPADEPSDPFGDIVTCTYHSAGQCTYFANDGGFASGSSQCPKGLRVAQDLTTDTRSSSSVPDSEPSFISRSVATGSSFILDAYPVSDVKTPEPTTLSSAAIAGSTSSPVASKLPGPTRLSSTAITDFDLRPTGSTSSPVPSASGFPQPGPRHKVKASAIAGGIVGGVSVIGAAIALLLCRRVLRRRAPGPVLSISPLPVQLEASPLTVTAGGQTVLAIDLPIMHSVAETQEELLPKITGRYKRSQAVNRNDREESGNRNVVGPAAGGAPLEMQMQMRAIAERMALMETRMQMRWLADEQPPGYTAA